jgi:hypothetical protein
VAVVIEQVESAGETEEERAEAAKAAEAARAALRASLVELTQKSVQNLVTAQKSLLDLAIKPVKAPPAPQPRAKARRGRPKRRVTVAA